MSCDGLEGLGSIRCVGNLDTRWMQHRRRCNDDEPGDGACNHGTRNGIDALQRDTVLIDVLIDDIVLSQKYHPGRDRGADSSDEQRYVIGIRQQARGHRRKPDLAPIGPYKKGSRYIGDENAAYQQQDLLDALKATAHGDEPDDEPHKRNRNSSRNAEQRQAARNARELGDGNGRVGNKKRPHRERREPNAEALADERGEALARNAAATRRSLLDHDEQHRHHRKNPKRAVAKISAST